jgi:flagellar basal-body rod protein FlgB
VRRPARRLQKAARKRNPQAAPALTFAAGRRLRQPAGADGTGVALQPTYREEARRMLNEMFANSPIPVLEQLVNFAQARHGVLASNVANIDTPGYRTKDLSTDQFQAKLKAAIGERDSGVSSLGAGPLATGEQIASDPFARVSDNMNNILYHDDSNVGLEQQVAAITKNHMQHNLALTILNSQFRLLQTAVSERA